MTNTDPNSRPLLETQLLQTYRARAALCLGLAMLVAASVLLGWTLQVEWLKRVAPGLIAMNPLTALCFLVAGAVLALSLDRGRRNRHYALAVLGSCLVLLTGLSKLLDVWIGTDLCPDDLLFSSQLALESATPSRITPNTAGCFVLLGLALLLLDQPAWPRLLSSQVLCLPLLLVPLAALVGYLYNSVSDGRVGAYVPMAVHSATNFLLLGAALILSRPELGAMRVIGSDTTGGRLARRLLPLAVIVPVLLGLLQLLGQRTGAYSAETGTALIALAIVLLLTGMILYSTHRLYGLDLERRSADQVVQMLATRTEREAYWSRGLLQLGETQRALRQQPSGGVEKILAQLLEHMDLWQGALYALEQDEHGHQELVALAVNAYGRPEQLSARFALGEGGVGQAARDRVVLTHSQVPAAYFHVRSGTGEMPLSELTFLPILLDEQLLGVLELASIGPLGADERKFLDQCLPVLALALLRHRSGAALAAA